MKTIHRDNVLCPFYREQLTKSITCDGLITDTTSQSVFKTHDAKVEFMAMVCCRNFRACELAQALRDKYI